MPLRAGSLRNIAQSKKWTADIGTQNEFCPIILEQMLSALDYLDYHGYVHRDVKPENILYYEKTGGAFHFQLADFGLANFTSAAQSRVGTWYYAALEQLFSGC